MVTQFWKTLVRTHTNTHAHFAILIITRILKIQFCCYIHMMQDNGIALC